VCLDEPELLSAARDTWVKRSDVSARGVGGGLDGGAEALAVGRERFARRST
jgi:hypothetical protein